MTAARSCMAYQLVIRTVTMRSREAVFSVRKLGPNSPENDCFTINYEKTSSPTAVTY